MDSKTHDQEFVGRHVGPAPDEQAKMLSALGYVSLDELTIAAIPEAIRCDRSLDLPVAASESGVTTELLALAGRNRLMTSMIGLGYADTVTPPVIQRNVLESPAWYTAYTPYQPEISQGRLEALLSFQTMVGDLTGLPIANASLLDEATAAAEAMALMWRVAAGATSRLLVDADCLPQTIAVLQTRALPLGIEVVVADLSEGELLEGEMFGLLLQYPGASGAVRDDAALVEAAHARGALVTVAADPLALTLLRAPGEIGADIAVGSVQRFGVPLGFGGPHAGYIAVRRGLERQLPGRLVGVSLDADGRPAYRLARQAREQHIRRERATSNICTAAVLPAVVAGLYAVWHGPVGLRRIAARVHRYAVVLAEGLREVGVRIVHDTFFDTVLAHVPKRAHAVVAAARDRGINLRLVDDDTVGIACDEMTRAEHVAVVWTAFGLSVGDEGNARVDRISARVDIELPEELRRSSAFLTHPVFHRYRSEASMLRYLRRLSDRDYALDRGMIPLGSCTMKLNATTIMQPAAWTQFSGLHPFAPPDQTEGYLNLITQLERWFAEITGYDAVSLQPNAGSQGELAGLLAIRAYHAANGQDARDVCLVPSSAHGTNAASARMAGMRVVVIRCDAAGGVDLDDLRAKLACYRDEVAAVMMTYPSTHGVYDETVGHICDLAHAAGGQVYLDGANLNALVGLAKPGRIGADVSHLNLHKTFGLPHGGGGAGVGPVAVRAHLAPYLPNHPMRADAGPVTSPGPVSAAPYGSAGILPIAWAYIRLMGPEGLKHASQVAVLAANYVATRLGPYFPVLYTGRNGLVAHECILDLRPLWQATGVTVEDVAKRLIDYGFHAPTVSFPVPSTLMIEPTESEDLAELDRFCDALIAIHAEIERVATGEWPREDNPLCNAPHTAETLAGDWTHPYTRTQAAYPLTSLRDAKYWAPVRRVNQAYGDRNLFCACQPMTA